MRVPFRERNPVPIGLSAFAVILVALLVAMNLERVPFLAGGREYSAAFAEAAGLKPDEEVRIAGVKVGKVTGLDLEGGHVKVTFRVNDEVRLGDLTRAEIKIKTVLGAHYVALDPRGTGRLNRQIPVERTAVPFEVVPAISELTQRVGKIDQRQVARSFDVLADTFRNSPDEIKASLQGLRRLSDTIASRDEELHRLTGRAKDVSQLLADRNQDFARLIQDGDEILQAVQARRQVIHQLLVNTVVLSQQVNALIKENEGQLRPMLDSLEKVNGILLKNQQNLDRILQLFAPFARQFADVTGTGRWFDSYIQNLIPIPASIKDAPAQGGGTGQGQTGQGQTGQGQTGQPGGRRTTNPLPFLP
ncbi:MCE family protein [Actinomadura viridis]|uniref:Phospholipid/cholesterol/gamma-HCH transport system substrate-binding protein n=1 Tax=Actinomadura viridis TaxID=58110 RepID=A0A931GGJ0_9ACTN|nr:MCE family protein [Actinomadura viridis]MBG6086390.1 phospholipid/cholesterol/gamma-HCH transport system substrate-binding protein [Actinomadura viridis]